MRVPRIYVEQSLSLGQQLTLDERAAHYVGQVLRMRTGRELILFNGDGSAYPATISEAGKKIVSCELGDKTLPASQPSPLNIELAIGISKGDRFDWVIHRVRCAQNYAAVYPTCRCKAQWRAAGEKAASLAANYD
jgi:16S rRNA (uracil1498-N3)-methyltransferase